MKLMNLSSKTVIIPSIVLLIGTVLVSSATNAFADDPFKNKVKIDTQQDNIDSCDESQQGDNNADCEITRTTVTERFTMEGEKNKILLDFDEKNKNDCDESGDGDNNSVCTITDTKVIGPIDILATSPP
jgi:hypothetical protein